MDATSLEAELLQWIAARNKTLGLRPEQITILERCYTGVGFYVEFMPDGDLTWDRSPIDGPQIAWDDSESVGGSLLWLSKDEPCCLEIYSFGTSFPENLESFELSQISGD